MVFILNRSGFGLRVIDTVQKMFTESGTNQQVTLFSDYKDLTASGMALRLVGEIYDRCVYPIVCLDDIYNDYQKDEDIDVAAKRVYSLLTLNDSSLNEEVVSCLRSGTLRYDVLKRRLMCRLISYKASSCNQFSIRLGNMALVFYVDVTEDFSTKVFVDIPMSTFMSWKIPVLRVFGVALSNVLNRQEPKLYIEGVNPDMSNRKVLNKLRESFVCDRDILLVTNTVRWFGLIMLFYPDLLGEIADVCCTNLAIIPVSVDSAVVFKCAYGMETAIANSICKQASSMGLDTNTNTRLVDLAVYKYDRKLRKIIPMVSEYK